MAKTTAVLGDERLDRRAELMLEQMVATRSLVGRKFSGTREGQIGSLRLLSSDRVTPDKLLAPHIARTIESAKGLRIVAAQDTTEINFAGRDARRKGLGPAGNGTAKGFFVHPLVAVDATSEAVIGVAGAKIWTRAETPTPPHQGRPFEDKESSRWLEGAAQAAKLRPNATQVIMVADREGDIYPLFARKPEAVDFVVRATHDRALADDGRLFAASAGWAELGRIKVKVASRGPGDKGRTATVALKAGRVTILKPVSSAE